MENQKQFICSEQIKNALIQYLATRPLQEVETLVNVLRQLPQSSTGVVQNHHGSGDNVAGEDKVVKKKGVKNTKPKK